MIFHRHRALHQRVVVHHRVASHRDSDVRELLTGGAVQLHVPACHRGVVLRRSVGAHRCLELRRDLELRHLMDAAADTGPRVAVAPERNEHVRGDPGADRHRRALQRGHRARTAHRGGGREAEVLAAEVGQQVFGHDRAARVGDDAIDVPRRQSGIDNGCERRLQGELQGALVGATLIPGLSNSRNSGQIAQGGHPVGSPREWSTTVYEMSVPATDGFLRRTASLDFSVDLFVSPVILSTSSL